MNTEPVAYRWRSNLGYIYDIYDHGGGEPLYTRPSEHDLGVAEAIGFDKGYQAATAKKTPTDEKFDRIFADGKRLGVLETEDRFRKAMNPTDEEILKIADAGEWHKDEFAINFARALLKKASEK
jgi:hypothetical protein